MTLKEARQQCRELGYTLRPTGHGDFELFPIGRRAEWSYFADSLQDAVNTAKIYGKVD